MEGRLFAAHTHSQGAYGARMRAPPPVPPYTDNDIDTDTHMMRLAGLPGKAIGGMPTLPATYPFKEASNSVTKADLL